MKEPLLHFLFRRPIRNACPSPRVVLFLLLLFLSLNQAEDLFAPSLLALLLEVLLKQAFHITTHAVLNFVEHGRIDVLSGLLTALE